MEDKTKILYVDDEEINLKLFEIHFGKKYEIFTCSSGQEGLAIIDQEPDILIVISDMKMPFMNGIEFIKQAKEKFPYKKYYILTGFDITQEINEALKTNLILKYFRKPFNIDEISKSFMNVIEKKN